MRKTILISLLTVSLAVTLDAQGLSRYQTVPSEMHTSAFRIEKLKKGDCTIISYALHDQNITITPRDDRHLGVQYLVSGKDCQACFEEEFQKMKFTGERFMPVAANTILIGESDRLPIAIHNDIIAAGETELYRTYLFSDNATSVPNDDIYLGSNFVIESTNPEAIKKPFELTSINDEFPDVNRWKDLFATHDYYKLREMQANKNNIVARLRDDRRLKDITPRYKNDKIKLKSI